MEVITAIHERRTIHEFLPDPLDQGILLRLLEAGTWAPNHKFTQPWRFISVGPGTRAQLADISAAHASSNAKPGSDAASIAQLQEKTRNKLLSKPTIVAIVCRRSDDPTRWKEDELAVAAAIQNIQLAAWSEGIGTKWSTGKVTQVPETANLLGVDPATEEILALLFFGKAAELPAARARKGIEELVSMLP
jgi:nitroreductase